MDQTRRKPHRNIRLRATRRIAAPAVIAAMLAAGPQQNASAQSESPTIDELWQTVQRQQAEIEALQRRLDSAGTDASRTDDRLAATEAQLEATTAYVESLGENADDGATTIGGYGEAHYNRLAAEDSGNDTDEIDFHRFVMFFSHRFSDRISFNSELELEHSLAGDGEPGEIELEQAYVDMGFRDGLSLKTGLFLLPVGILNETHEPNTFYGVERNDVESIIVPSTWWEAGSAVTARLQNGLSFDFALHSGLAMPTSGSSAYRIRSGRQKVAEAMASDPAYTARIRYTGLPGLELAASYQYQSDPSQIAGDGLDSGKLWTTHLAYARGNFGLRALYSSWSFDGVGVELAGADRQRGWYLEPSYRLNERWGIYTRYEDIEAVRNQDRFAQWEAGFNFWPVPNVVLKFDYRRREHDLASEAGRDFDGIDLGMGYQF